LYIHPLIQKSYQRCSDTPPSVAWPGTHESLFPPRPIGLESEKKGRRSRASDGLSNRWDHSFPIGRRRRFRWRPSPGAHGIHAVGRSGRRLILLLNQAISLHGILSLSLSAVVSEAAVSQAVNPADRLSACSVPPIPAAGETAPPREWCRPRCCPGFRIRSCS